MTPTERETLAKRPNEQTRQEVRDLIAFYDERGSDWTDAAAYTLMRAVGMWPLPNGWFYRRAR